MSELLTTEPASVTAGDSISWQISLPDYPASAGYTLKYKLLGSAGALDLVSTASGDDHLITVTPAASALWAAGDYIWKKYVESTTERYTLEQGNITVEADWTAIDAATDTRSNAKKNLDAIEAVMNGTATRSVLEKEIDGVRLKYCVPADLLQLRERYALAYWRELNPGKLCPQINLTIGGYCG